MEYFSKILLNYIDRLLHGYIVKHKKDQQFNNLTIQQSSFGFTLIELLVAIAVVGILATGLAIAVNPVAQLQKSRDAKRIEALKQIKSALELYYQDYGRYPLQGTNYTMRDASTNADVAWGSSWSPYMQTLPSDSSKQFRYWVDSTNGQTYALYASLDRAENTCKGVQTDPCDSAGTRVGSPTGSGAYNYAITSGNTSP